MNAVRTPSVLLERVANTAVIVAAGVFIYVWLSTYGTPPRSANRAGAPVPAVGSPLGVSGALAEALQQERTLLVVLSSTCPVCTDAMPFYRRLVDAAASAGEGPRLVVAGYEAVDAMDRYLRQHGVSPDEVIELDREMPIGIQVVPTLLLLGREAVVEQVWTGRLTEDAEKAVLSTLFGPLPVRQ